MITKQSPKTISPLHIGHTFSKALFLFRYFCSAGVRFSRRFLKRAFSSLRDILGSFTLGGFAAFRRPEAAADVFAACIALACDAKFHASLIIVVNDLIHKPADYGNYYQNYDEIAPCHCCGSPVLPVRLYGKYSCHNLVAGVYE